MKGFWLAGYLGLLIVLSTIVCQAQGNENPEGYGTFEIGWSSDGKIIAYGEFEKSEELGELGEIDIKRLCFFIVDLVTDKELWKTSWSWKVWEETCPKAVNGALDLMVDEIDSKLMQFGIPARAPLMANPLNPFPFITDGNEVAIEIREKNTGDYYSTYEIFAISNPLGEKSIFTFKGPQENTDRINILGYSVNPQKSRMAVFIYSSEGSYDGHIIGNMYVSGCHLTAGFQKMDH